MYIGCIMESFAFWTGTMGTFPPYATIGAYTIKQNPGLGHFRVIWINKIPPLLPDIECLWLEGKSVIPWTKPLSNSPKRKMKNMCFLDR